MKEPDQKVLDRALKLHQEGKRIREILELTELNYSQAWLYITDAELPASQRVKTSDATALKVRNMRDEDLNSWGLISVRLGYKKFPESKVRRMYEEASGDKSQGLRIGRGGRYLDGDAVLYADDRRKPGIRLPSGTSRADVHELSSALREGKVRPKKASAATTKAVAKKAGVVKEAKPRPSKKAVKAAKKRAPQAPVIEADEDEDPFQNE